MDEVKINFEQFCEKSDTVFNLQDTEVKDTRNGEQIILHVGAAWGRMRGQILSLTFILLQYIKINGKFGTPKKPAD